MKPEETYRSKLRENPQKTTHYITLSEAMNNGNGAVSKYVICPPESGDINVATDEEVENDDDSLAEVAGEVDIEFSDGDASSTNDNDTEEEGMEVQRWRKHKYFDEELPSACCDSIPDRYPDLLTKTEYELWKLFFDDSIIELIKTQTILYARRERNMPKFELTVEELQHFLGIILFSGYHTLPSERDYWSTQVDLGVPIVASTMPRDR